MGARRNGRERARTIIKAPKHVAPKNGLLHSRSQCKIRPGVYLLMTVELSGSGFCAARTTQTVSAAWQNVIALARPGTRLLPVNKWHTAEPLWGKAAMSMELFWRSPG